MALAIVEARRKATDNRTRLDGLAEVRAALVKRYEDEELRQDVVRARVHSGLLVPFAAALSRLKDVRLAEFSDFQMPGLATSSAFDLACDLDGNIGAGRTLLGGAGSAAGMGAGVGAATWAAAGMFGAASTGTPIAALSGVAASNATLAFLGGGSLAAGGGGMAVGTAVLGGVVAVPALVVGAGVVTALGRRDLRAQDELAAELDALCTEFDRVDSVLQRAQRVREVLQGLREAGETTLPAVMTTLEQNQEPSTWSEADRVRVAAMVELVVVTTALMRAPLADSAGEVADDDGGALADATLWLRMYYGEVR